jgi:hypothetical protein
MRATATLTGFLLILLAAHPSNHRASSTDSPASG